METLRTVDLSEGKFECNGKTYHACSQLSFPRYEKLQTLLIEFAYSGSVGEIYTNLKTSFDKLNGQKFAEAAIAIHNTMKGIENIDKKSIPALKICALFWNIQGEDLADSSDIMIDSKLSEWGKELDVNPFFHQAVCLLPEWRAAYLHYTQNILQSQPMPEA